MIRPSSLWEQYMGKAISESVRGAGLWPLQPHPCALEPPWDEFDRRSVNLWDCLLHHWEGPWEGSWFRRLLSWEPFLRRGASVALPAIPCRDWDGLEPITFDQFPDDESTIAKCEQFLRALPALTRPISFELLGVGARPEFDYERLKQILKENETGKTRRDHSEAISGWAEPFTQLQFVAHRDDAPRVERMLTLHFPNSAVIRSEKLNDDYDHEAAGGIQSDRAWAAPLVLEGYFYWPIRIFTKLDPDPLGVAIAAMEDLGKWDWALLQVLFEPVKAPWPETVREAVSHPYKNRDFLVTGLSERVLQEKFSTPLFAVSIRLAARKKDVFRQLLGWSEQFAAPPQRFVGTHELFEGEQLAGDELDALAQSIDFRNTRRPGLSLNTEELASLIHLPGKAVVSERLRRVKTRTRPVAEIAPKPDTIVLGENVHRGKKRIAQLAPEMRARHCYLAGATGTGKSTLLLNMIIQDIRAGHGVALLDPHGDLVHSVLERIPPHRVDDVILFDPTDEEFPFGLNILEARDEDERERIVAETVMALERYFPASWGPRLERILTFTLYTVLEVIPGATLADVERMLTDDKFQQDVVSKVKDQRILDFWKGQFPFLKRNALDPVLNKLSVFLINKTVRNIICQRHSAIDFDRLLNEGKILLAKISTGRLTEKIAGMFGSFLVTKIVNAAFRRESIPEHQRRPFYFYVDEFQAFMNVSVGFERILAEARKYKLILAGLANQYVGQLSIPVRQAILGSVGTLVVFRLGIDDAGSIARELGVFTADEILNLDMGQAIVRAGKSSTTFNLQTYPPPPVEAADPSSKIRSRMREEFARPRSEVEAMLRGIGTRMPRPEPHDDDRPDLTDPNEDDLIN